MTAYQRKTLVPSADVGLPGELPDDLFGLEDYSLADLPLAIGTPAATELGYLNTGFFPVPDPPPETRVGAGALRVAVARAGKTGFINSALGGLSSEFTLWWDHQPTFALSDNFITVLAAAAGITADMPAIFTVAATAQPT